MVYISLISLFLSTSKSIFFLFHLQLRTHCPLFRPLFSVSPSQLYLLCSLFLSSFCTEAGVRLQAQAVHFHLTYTQSFSSLLLKLLIDDDGRYIETTKSTQRWRKLQRYSGGVSYIKTTTTTVVYGKALPTSPHLFTSSPSVFSSRAQALHRSSLSPLFKLRRPAVNGCEEAPP